MLIPWERGSVVDPPETRLQPCRAAGRPRTALGPGRVASDRLRPYSKRKH